MPDEKETKPTEKGGGSEQQPGNGNAAPVAAAPAAPTTPAPTGSGEVLTIPRSAMARVKEEQRERGRKEAQAELDAEAKKHGFTSFKDVFPLVAQLKQQTTTPKPAPAAKPAQQPNAPRNGGTGPMGNKNGNGDSKERERWMRERETLSKSLKIESRRRRDLQRTLDAREAEWALTKTAMAVGIKDPDYAIRLLTKHLDEIGATDPEKVKGFDERKFFEGLREQKPFLFGEVVENVTTGPGATSPPAPRPTQGSPDAGKPVDAKTMTSAQLSEHLRKRGLDPGYTAGVR